MEPSAKRPRPDFCRRGSRPNVLQRVPSTLSVGLPVAENGKDDCAAWFQLHDLDGDGRLTEEEYRALLLSVGAAEQKLHPQYVEHVLAQTTFFNGSVTLQAFREVHAQLQSMDRVLRVPRRAAAAAQPAASMFASSRVARRSSILLPNVPSVEHSVGRGERKTTFVLPERYSKLEPIGEGAYGVLVLATDALAPEGAGRTVAIKR